MTTISDNKLTNHEFWAKMWKKNKNRHYKFNKRLPWFVDWLAFQEQYFPKKENLKILEVGCAASRWLPIYKSHFKYDVFGVDYDKYGCELAENILAVTNEKGKIVCADFINYSDENENIYDIVVSFGFIEHFSGTEILERMKKVLKPGGIIFAEVPNHQGLQGLLVGTILDYKSTHIIFSPEKLTELFKSVGFSNIQIKYAGGYGVPLPRGVLGWRKLFFPLHLSLFAWLSLMHFLSRILNISFRSKNFANSIMVIAIKD